MEQWLEYAREEKLALRSAKGKHSQSMVVMPLFRGEYIDRVYDKFILNIEHYSAEQKRILRASGVPRRLNGDQWKNWGGKLYRELRVHGVLVNTVTSTKASVKGKPAKGLVHEPRFIALTVTSGGKYLGNQMLILGMLNVRGFATPLKFTSWIEADEVNKTNLEKRLKVVSRLITKAEQSGGRLPKPVGLQLYRSHTAW